MAKRILEIRTYNLKPGTRDKFHHLVVERSYPMLARWGVDVVAFGPSLHDSDSYFLMRAYASLADRVSNQEAFYGSAEWRDGPRAAIISLIESHASLAIEVEEETIESLRKLKIEA